MNRILCLLAASLISLPIVAKKGKYLASAKVSEVGESGFYRIPIQPSLDHLLVEKFDNLRLINSKGNEVPILVSKEKDIRQLTLFRTYDIDEIKVIEGCCTYVTVHNPEKKKINNLTFTIRNAEVTKRVKLSGSDDGEQWYVVKDRYQIRSIQNNQATSDLNIIQFPLTDYEYYRLEIDDSTSAPINVINCGYYDVINQRTRYSRLPGLKFSQTDSAKRKKSYLHVKFPQAYYMDGIHLHISSPSYFFREANIALLKTKKWKKQKERRYYENEYSLELNSNQFTSFDLYNFYTQSFWIIIDNEDNPPLQIDSIETFRVNRYVDTYLTKGESYTLKVGEKDLRAPDYDLRYFKDSLPEELPKIQHKEPVIIQEKDQIDQTSFFEDKGWIWVAILAVILLLGYITVKMIREMNA